MREELSGLPVAGNWAVPVVPLLAARGEKLTKPSIPSVSATDLTNVTSAALTRLGDAGAEQPVGAEHHDDDQQ